MTLPESTKFSHPHDICYGRGRIIWAAATTSMSGHYHPEGWVLPGGRRTHNIAEAKAAAQYVHEACG